MTYTRFYAAWRWAKAVAGVIDAAEDPRTIGAWGSTIGVSDGALRTWCVGAKVNAKHSRDFARLLRAIYASRSRPWVPEQLLDVTDPRTLELLLVRGGLNGIPRPTIDIFLQNQQLIQNPDAIEELRKILHARDII